MANLETAIQRAGNVKPGTKEAAKMHNDISHELELGAGGDEDRYKQGEQALRILEQRDPGVDDRAAELTEPPRLSRGASSQLHEGRAHGGGALQAKTRRQHQRERKQPNRTLRQRAASATAIHARPNFGRRFAQTGIPAAGESAAELTMKTIGWIVGLSFFGLLLSPRGSRAVTAASNGGVYALRALVSANVDPLRSSRAQQAASGAAARGSGTGIPLGQTVGAAIRSVDQATAAVGLSAAPLHRKPASAQGGIHR